MQRNQRKAKPSARKAPKKSAQGRKSSGQRGPKNLTALSGMQSVGAAIGHVAPRSFFSRGGRAQQLADQDPTGSERITGCDLFASPIKSGSSTAAAGFGGTATYWQDISPSTISSRLQAIEEMYQWYAIRDLKVSYTPACGTGTTGSVAVGIVTDQEVIGQFPTPTQQQTLEMQPALLVPVWGFGSMELKMRGTKLFENYSSGTDESGDTRIQAAIAAVILGGVASTTYGQLWLSYTIDFYQPVPLLSSVDLFRLGKNCPRCHQVCDREVKGQPPRTEGLDHKTHPHGKSFVGSADREPDDYVVLRAQEPSSMDLRPDLASAARVPLSRDERLLPVSNRTQSLKG